MKKKIFISMKRKSIFPTFIFDLRNRIFYNSIHKFYRMRSENSRNSIPRHRRFPMNRIVPGITTIQASGEWKAPRQSHEWIGTRAACLHVIRSHHVRVHCGLPRWFLSRIMVGLNYYVAPSYGETTVKVSCNPDCNLRTCSSLCVR